MKTILSDFDEQTCQLFNPLRMFALIHCVTNGDPGTTGCIYFDHGKCPGYQKLHNNAEKTTKLNSISNADIAAKLNCSSRQVSKMRKKRTLPKPYK